jgi:hypothetical protein
VKAGGQVVGRRRWSRPALRIRPWVLLASITVAWGLLPTAIVLFQVLRHGGVVTGANGLDASGDQFQYLAWIRDSGAHGLIANSFQVPSSSAVFLQPMFLLSGLLWRLGVAIQLTYLIWVPIAALTLVAGYMAFASLIERPWLRVLAVTLALFYLSPVLAVIDWTGHVHGENHFYLLLSGEELSPVLQLWGYPPTAIALGLTALAMALTYRILDGDEAAGGPRNLALAATAGLLASWLHPWQGATLALIWAGLLAMNRAKGRSRRLIWPLLAAAAPLAYYQILSRSDAAWKLSDVHNRPGHLVWWALLAALAPLAIPAALTLRRRLTSLGDQLMWLWIAAGLVVYFAEQEFPEHALQSLSLPLAVLAVSGWRHLRLSRSVAAAALASLIVPGLLWSVLLFNDSRNSHASPYVLTTAEHDALTYLNRAPQPGAVLANPYLGMAVPAFAGRRTVLSNTIWARNVAHNSVLAGALFSDKLAPGPARAFVRSTGVRFLLSDCGEGANLSRVLGSLVSSVSRFGCVGVYRLRARLN